MHKLGTSHCQRQRPETQACSTTSCAEQGRASLQITHLDRGERCCGDLIHLALWWGAPNKANCRKTTVMLLQFAEIPSAVKRIIDDYIHVMKRLAGVWFFVITCDTLWHGRNHLKSCNTLRQHRLHHSLAHVHSLLVSPCSSGIITVHCHSALWTGCPYVCGVVSRSKVEVLQLQQWLHSRSEPLSADVSKGRNTGQKLTKAYIWASETAKHAFVSCQIQFSTDNGK